jgi:hypothetical protein
MHLPNGVERLPLASPSQESGADRHCPSAAKKKRREFGRNLNIFPKRLRCRLPKGQREARQSEAGIDFYPHLPWNALSWAK